MLSPTLPVSLALNLDDHYTVEFSVRAFRELKRLDHTVRQRLLKAVEILSDHPRPPAARALVGHPGLLRVRVGDYRITYMIDEGVVRILVVAVGHRREIYRNLP